MVENGEILFFLKNGEMVKNGDLNFKNFSHNYFISSLEYISMIVYTNVENHLFSYLLISYFHKISIIVIYYPLRNIKSMIE